MNTIHSEQNASKALLDAEQGNSGERIRGLDGWVITVHERDAGAARDRAGLTMTRRFEIIANTDSDRAPAKTVTLMCSEEELAGFRLACAEAARAQLEITNPLAGLRHYRTSMLAFPFLPGLDGLRDQLMQSAAQMVEALLHTADECLQQRRTWAAAKPALDRVQTLIEIEDALQVAFGARYALLCLLAERTHQLAQRTLPQEEAIALLRDLRDELGDDPASYWHLPGWRSLRTRLANVEAASRQQAQAALSEARRQFIADAGRACNDAAAGHFLEQHARRGDVPPADEAIAQLQLDETEALLRCADELMYRHRVHENALEEMAAPDETMRAAMALLHEETNKLESWRRDLQTLLGALHVARHFATRGLREPAQFDVARYVLNIGGRAPATPLRQAPAMFVGHPSLLRGKAYVDECAARRSAQQQLFREITLCLQAAHEPHALEMALAKLRAMKREEPADACGLQKDLGYIDAQQREHASLPAIEAILQRDVDQMRVLRDWLAQFTRAGAGFPGVVDWSEEKQHVETLRDSGPAGLTEAQARCRLVKAGDADGMVDGQWPLVRMCSALSQENMLAHLRLVLGEANVVPLCAAARTLDEQRHAMWRASEKSLRECNVLLKDIAARIERYPAAWDAFEMAHRALMATPVWRRRRIAYSANWQDYQQAADAFNGICPHYSAFRARLHDVKARFHLVPAFMFEHEGHEEHHA